MSEQEIFWTDFERADDFIRPLKDKVDSEEKSGDEDNVVD